MTNQEANHKFENCPVLNNSELLRQNFINFCQIYKRGKRALTRPTERNVHQVTKEDNDSKHQDQTDDDHINNTTPTYDDHDSQDFRKGGI